MIPQEKVQEVISTARIEEVVEDYVDLKKRGVNLLGLCPFHNEKTPSFTVSPDKNLYKCFGCGRGGGVVNFLMEHESFSFVEAIRHLARRYNITIEEVQKDDSQIQAEKERQSAYIINDFAQSFFEDQLWNTPEGKNIGLSYLKQRGFLESTIKTFGLGYSPQQRDKLVSLAIDKQFNKDKLQALGLMSRSGLDFFRERVIFPFYNLSGKIIGFGGRILKKDPRAPKYLNSPESDIYNKRKTLYGLFQAKKYIRQKNQCILVEGYTDVISLHQNGIKNVVASSGTSLTKEQVLLIKRFASSALVLYDGDQAGQNAALRGLDIFIENNVDVYLVVLPDGEDPDSYVRKLGTEDFSNFLAQESQDFILRYAHTIQAQFANDPIHKSKEIQSLMGSVAKLQDQIKRSLYIKECAQILDVEESNLVKSLHRAIDHDIKRRQKSFEREARQKERLIKPTQPTTETPKTTPEESDAETPSIAISQDEYQERDLVRVLLEHGQKVIPESEDQTGAQYFFSLIEEYIDEIQNTLYRNIITEYKSLHDTQPDSDFQQHFIQHQDAATQQLTVDVLTWPYEYAEWSKKGVELQTQKPYDKNHKNDIYLAVMRFFTQYYLRQDEEWQQRIKNCEEAELAVYLTAYQKFKKMMQQHANELGRVVY